MTTAAAPPAAPPVSVPRRSGAAATFRRAVVDQLRLHASSPTAIFSTLALPCVIAFLVHDSSPPGTRTTTDLAVGSAGIGMLDSVIVLVVFSFMSEKHWRTLPHALGGPVGLVPVLLGRLAGIAVQSLTALPGTCLILVGLWGLDGSFRWARWLVGGLLLAAATTSVVGLLGLAVLRFRYSSGMTNGLTGLVMALSALIVPPSALPGPVRALSTVLPQSHVMAWVRGGSVTSLLLAVVLTAVFVAVTVAALRRLEFSARRLALPLES